MEPSADMPCDMLIMYRPAVRPAERKSATLRMYRLLNLTTPMRNPIETTTITHSRSVRPMALNLQTV